MAQGENMETIADIHHLSAYFVAALLIAVFVMIFTNRIYAFKENIITSQARQLITQLGLVLDSNNTHVWTFDIPKNIFTAFSDQGKKRTEYAPIDFSQFFLHEDFNSLRQLIGNMRDQQSEHAQLVMRGHQPTEEVGMQHVYDVNISVLQRDGKGRPQILIGTQRDITEDTLQREERRKLAMRYHTVFNSSLADMIYYDEDGILTDINDKALTTFHVKDRQSFLDRRIHINDIPPYRNVDFTKLENNVKLSSFVDVDRVKQEDERIPESRLGGKVFYESTITTLRDADNKLQGIIISGRGITEMVMSHHRQKENTRLLNRTTKNIEAYIDNINYTLRVSGVRLINYYPDSHELVVFSDLNKAEHRLSQIRCASLLHAESRRRLRGIFTRMDRRHQGAFMETFRTRFRDEQGRDVYMTFSVVPFADNEGRITHYFGMSRNDTEMHYTEARLREETEKARETEELKNTFLQNMSYEIRTPLNAVLGFAQLYNNPHDEADEPVFAEEIKRNTGELLSLVNDILFISRLDARMVEFNKTECDFAAVFDGYCYMGFSELSPGVSISVENPYSRLVVTIDEQYLGQSIQKLCAMAARHTTQGFIRTKCEYHHGELNIMIEDTGRGHEKESLAHVFDRFARNESNERYGTGLDLPIIHELIEQMGGILEIQSEPDKGNTLYISIPCEMSSMEKKTDKTQ